MTVWRKYDLHVHPPVPGKPARVEFPCVEVPAAFAREDREAVREVLADYCALTYGAGVLADGPGDAFTFRPDPVEVPE